MEFDLLPYQVEGAVWLAAQRGGLLADEMGLGKSAQAIVACDAINAERILVVCPASARINWEREFKRFSTQQRTTTVLSTGGKTPLGALTICSYELATRKGTNTLLRAVNWDVLILDEAHYLKTPDAQRTHAVYGKKGLVRSAKRTYALTGTPAPNNASELWTLLYTFGATQLGYLNFIDRYCITDQMGRVQGNNLFTIHELKQKMNKVMMRRMKTEVLKDLPPITFGDVTVEASPVNVARWFPNQPDLKAELAHQEAMVRAVLDQDEEALGDTHVTTLRRYTGLAKVPAAIEMLKTEFEGGLDKIVVFAVHRDVVTLLKEGLSIFNPVVVFGGTSMADRQAAVDRFQKDPACRVFIGNVTSAGTAITLTAASNVLFVEASWTPADNAQAAMRVHRIGQSRPCLVRYVTLQGSIDEAVTAVLRRKTKDLAALFCSATPSSGLLPNSIPAKF